MELVTDDDSKKPLQVFSRMPLLPLSLFSLCLHIPRVSGEEQLTVHDWYKSDLEFFLLMPFQAFVKSSVVTSLPCSARNSIRNKFLRNYESMTTANRLRRLTRWLSPLSAWEPFGDPFFLCRLCELFRLGCWFVWNLFNRLRNVEVCTANLFQLVNGMGNPRVSPAVPIPVPIKPAGIAVGTGFRQVWVMGFQKPVIKNILLIYYYYYKPYIY